MRNFSMNYGTIGDKASAILDGADPQSFNTKGTDAGALATPSAPPVQPPGQTDGVTPGPSENPGQGQGGPPPDAGGPPPAMASAVSGVQGSEATGGVQGSFGQAGSADFAKRFGGSGPANWFRNASRAGAVGASGAPGGMNPNAGRGNTAVGGTTGGGSVQTIPEPSMGPSSGSAGDEEWQRFMQQVLKNRFGGGR